MLVALLKCGKFGKSVPGFWLLAVLKLGGMVFRPCNSLRGGTALLLSSSAPLDSTLDILVNTKH
jgi:hypothetical protein